MNGWLDFCANTMRTRKDSSIFQDAVLVVDDEPFILKTTAAALKRLGYQSVYTVDTVQKAVDAINASSSSFDLLLVDLNMPDSDGLELLRQCEEMGFKGHILLFSGEDSQTLSMAERLALELGLSVIGTLEKPFKPEVFTRIVSDYTENQEYKRRRQTEQHISPAILKRAIDHKEIIPWYQPKIDIKTEQPVGVEALARWPRSATELVCPDTFIPVAEEHGLIDVLTLSIVEQAASCEAHWRGMGIHLQTAINLSMDSLNNVEFPNEIVACVNKVNGELQQLQFEVTESQLRNDLAHPLEALLRLRMHKVCLSIDDFGTGHSNLSQLRDLPFDELKLDRSYIESYNKDERSAVILDVTVSMAKKLGIKVVAEGVETIEEWNIVKRLGCDQVQGYFTAKPMPGEDIPEWIAEWPETRRKLFGNT